MFRSRRGQKASQVESVESIAGKHRIAGRAGRSRRAGRAVSRRPIAFGLVPVLIAAVAVVGGVATNSLVSASTAGAATPAATTVPGKPGVPQAGTVLYDEGFENGTSNTQQPLATYAGTSGDRFDATDLYRSLVDCNFTISNGIGNSPPAYCTSGPTPKATIEASTRALATELGGLNGRGAANHALVEMTGHDTPTPGSYIAYSTTPITLPSTLSNRFVTLSVNADAICRDNGPGFVQAVFALQATVPGLVGLSGPISPCALGRPVGTFYGSGSVLFTGKQIGARIVGLANAGQRGNDSAYDDIKVIDVTPQLDKAFSPTSVPVNGKSTLTWTVTNTSELAAKNGWSFTDTLPTNLVVASPAATKTTCPAGVVTPAADGKSVTAKGNLSAGMKSCTFSVETTSAVAGEYTNDASNVTEVGLNPPGPAKVTFVKTAPMHVVKKVNSARVQSGDEFVVTLKDSTGAALTKAQTANGAMQASSSTVNVFVGSTYTITDTMAPGSPDSIGAYNGDIVCSDDVTGNQVPASADPGPWTVTVANTDGITCVVHNTAASPAFSVMKTVSPSGPVLPGTTLKYTIVVKNLTAVPYLAPNLAAFTDNLNDVIDDATTVGSPIATSGTAFFAATDTSTALQWSGALTATGTPGSSATITYSVKVNDPDTGNGILKNVVVTTSPGGNCPARTANPDPNCSTTSPVPSYTVVKTASVTSAGAGDTVKYTIKINNNSQGAYTAAMPASIKDDLSDVLDDASLFNPETIATALAMGATGQAAITNGVLSWSGALPVHGQVTITYSVLVNPVVAGKGNQMLDNVVVTPPGSGGSCPATPVNPLCVVVVPVRGYSVVKSVSEPVANAGDTVTYTLKVTNTGGFAYTDAAPASLTDNLTDVLTDATFVANSATSGATFDGVHTLSWSGKLDPKQMVTITYQVKVDDPAASAGTHSLDNLVVTPPGSGGSCPAVTPPPVPVGAVAGSTAPAVLPLGCSTHTPVRSFQLTKTASTTSVVPGGKVTFTITVHNTGNAAYDAAHQASFTDDLSKVLDDATYNNDVVTVSHQPDPTGAAQVTPYMTEPGGPVMYTLSWKGALAVGQTVTIMYSVTVNNPDTGDKKLVNTVVNPRGTGGNCPAGSTDPACTTGSGVQSFSVAKAASASKALPGDKVTYTITVTNTGTIAYDGLTAATSAGFTDTLAGDLDDAVYNADAKASDGSTPNYRAPVLSWTGALPVKGVVTVIYSVTVNKPDVIASGNGDGFLSNVAVPTSGTGGSCALCTTVTPIQQLTLGKTASATTANPGDTVTYTITAKNTGQVPFTTSNPTNPATFTDDLSALADDGTVTVPSNTGATYDLSTHILKWTGDLAVGATATVAYSVTINNPDTTGDHWLKNTVVSGSGTGGNCTDATTAAKDSDCTPPNIPIASYTTVKKASVSKTTPGGTVTYTITVTNTGNVAYGSANPASFTDDLTSVLDDATLNTDLATTSGTLNYSKPVLKWSGQLAVAGSTGNTATVTYSVKVDNPDNGDLHLKNAVVTTGTGGNCPTGSSSSSCSTNVPDVPSSGTDAATITNGGTLAFTGVAASSQLLIALLALALGAGLLVLTWRRKRS